MSSTNERQTPNGGLTFFAKSQLLSADDVARGLKRMAHEIVERNESLDDVVIIGLQTGGKPFAEKIVELLRDISKSEVPMGMLDVSFYRDDLSLHPVAKSAQTIIDVDLTGKTVILVDDVLYTGRTIRASFNALSDYGRPKAIQLCVMVDRGHRELPIRPDFVGKNLPTSEAEAIVANLEGVWIGEKK